MARTKNQPRKTFEVLVDGAFGRHFDYLAAQADALAARRDEERTASAILEVLIAEEKRQAEEAVGLQALEARRQAQMAPRPCLRCQAVLPPEAFERHGRAYNGRMGACRPCAKIIRDRKTASGGARQKEALPLRACLACNGAFVPAHHKTAYCSEDCREQRQFAARAARYKASYAADPERWHARSRAWRTAHWDKMLAHRRAYARAHREQERTAHAAWVNANRERYRTCQREWARRRAKKK